MIAIAERFGWGLCLGLSLALLDQAQAYQVRAYCGYDWLSSCSLVPAQWGTLNGAFSPDIQAEPPRVPASHPTNNFMSLGGHKVGGTIPNADRIVQMMNGANCENLDFDMEGVIQEKYSTVTSLAQGVHARLSGAKIQVTCLGGDYWRVAPRQASFDSIAIMLYADTMQSGGWSIPESDPYSGQTWPQIQKWLDSSIPNDKIILGMTTAGLKPYMVDWYKELIAQYGLQGLSLWKIKDLEPTGVTIACFENPQISCTNPQPTPAPAPQNICNGNEFTVHPGDSCWKYWQECPFDFFLCCTGEGKTCVKQEGSSKSDIYSGDTCYVSQGGACPSKSISTALRVSTDTTNELLCDYMGRESLESSVDLIEGLRVFDSSEQVGFERIESNPKECEMELELKLQFEESRYDINVFDMVQDHLEDAAFLQNLQSSGIVGSASLSQVRVEEIPLLSGKKTNKAEKSKADKVSTKRDKKKGGNKSSKHKK